MDNFNLDVVKNALDKGIAQAQELMKDPSKIDALLVQLEDKLQEVPLAGTTLASVPTMVSMVKSYISKEYTEVSPKVIASMVGAFLYLITGKDLINDKTPLIGHIDDIAVFALALNLVQPELEAYKAWRDAKNGETPVSEEE